MAKYDNQLGELKSRLPNAKNILIALPTDADIDKFAAGLALFLAFEAQGKQVSIVSEDTIRVTQAHLFGVDHIKNNISQSDGGNLTIVLEGVVGPNGTVPALEKLDWYPEGQNLNLVFKVLPGQTFRPASITPRYAGSGYDSIFTIGAANLNALGNIYTQNSQAFSGVHTVNIDNQSTNTGFGSTNVNDPNSSSVSEIMVDLLQSLGLPFDEDIASNQKVGPDTYLAVAQCLRVGGRKPGVTAATSQPPEPSPAESSPTQPNQGLSLSSLFPSASIAQSNFSEPTGETGSTVSPPSPSSDNQPLNSNQPPMPSPEERPQQEGLNSADLIEVEPGWLTPKVFKGTSAG